MSEAIEPTASYIDWITDPEGAAKAVEAATEGLWEQSGIVAGAIAVCLGALRVARFVPGWGPAVHSIGTAALNWIKPKDVAKSEEKAKKIEGSVWKIAEQIERLPESDQLTKRLKELIKENTPEEFNEAFAAWKKERQDAGV